MLTLFSCEKNDKNKEKVELYNQTLKKIANEQRAIDEIQAMQITDNDAKVSYIKNATEAIFHWIFYQYVYDDSQSLFVEQKRSLDDFYVFNDVYLEVLNTFSFADNDKQEKLLKLRIVYKTSYLILKMEENNYSLNSVNSFIDNGYYIKGAEKSFSFFKTFIGTTQEDFELFVNNNIALFDYKENEDVDNVTLLYENLDRYIQEEKIRMKKEMSKPHEDELKKALELKEILEKDLYIRSYFRLNG